MRDLEVEDDISLSIYLKICGSRCGKIPVKDPMVNWLPRIMCMNSLPG